MVVSFEISGFSDRPKRLLNGSYDVITPGSYGRGIQRFSDRRHPKDIEAARVLQAPPEPSAKQKFPPHTPPMTIVWLKRSKAKTAKAIKKTRNAKPLTPLKIAENRMTISKRTAFNWQSESSFCVAVLPS